MPLRAGGGPYRERSILGRRPSKRSRTPQWATAHSPHTTAIPIEAMPPTRIDHLPLIHISEPTRQEATPYAVFRFKKT